MTSNTIYFLLTLKIRKYLYVNVATNAMSIFIWKTKVNLGLKCAYGVFRQFFPTRSLRFCSHHQWMNSLDSTPQQVHSLFWQIAITDQFCPFVVKLFLKNVLNITQQKCEHKLPQMEQIRKYIIYYNNSYFSISL